MSFRMPAEWAPHERTLMCWPCRVSSWGDALAEGRREFAAVANAIVRFEPVTMICPNTEQARDARRMLDAPVDVVVHPIDGSWVRDNGPLYVTDGCTRRARHFRFNGWGERNANRDRDARLGKTVAEELGDPVDAIDVVLEGGALSVDGAGLLVAPEGCVMHPNRNWYLTRGRVEQALSEALGLTRVVWLEQGMAQDMNRDPSRMYYGTDGHADLFLSFIDQNKALMLQVESDDPNAATIARSKAILTEAGIEVVDFPFQSGFMHEGRWYIAPYMNFYFCNGAVIVPVAGEEPHKDQAALDLLARLLPGREVVPVRLHACWLQGGGVHCMTMQVPVRP